MTPKKLLQSFCLEGKITQKHADEIEAILAEDRFKIIEKLSAIALQTIEIETFNSIEQLQKELF